MSMKSVRCIVGGLGMLVAARSLDATELKPVADADAIRFAQERGFELYEYDRAASLATDAALAIGGRRRDVRGWVTSRTIQGWLVRFVAYCPENLCSVVDVRLNEGRATAELVQPPAPLSSQETTAWQVGMLAQSSNFKRCSDIYNLVVLPPKSQNGDWTVYLLPATTEPNVVILAGFNRITISNDGREIRKSEALSVSCMEFEVDSRVVGLAITHVIDPYPIETHVFASLNYRLPVHVRTEKGLFLVNGTTITAVE